MQHSHDVRAGKDPFRRRPRAARLALEPGWLVDGSCTPAGGSYPGGADPSPHSDPESGGPVSDPMLQHFGSPQRVPPTPPHPLAGTAHLDGMSDVDLQHLTRLFQRVAPASEWTSRQSALAHLGSLLRIWPVRSWKSVRGLHVLLGAGGSGKTSMMLKMAGHLQASGSRVALIALFPDQPLQSAAFKAAADQLALSAAVAETTDTWLRALESFAGCETLLVDTPCLLSDPGTARRIMRLEAMQSTRTVLHQVLCLHHRREFLQRQLELSVNHSADFIALPKADLAPGPGALIALQLMAGRAFSLMNRSPHLDEPLVEFGTDAFLAALQRSPS